MHNEVDYYDVVPWASFARSKITSYSNLLDLLYYFVTRNEWTSSILLSNFRIIRSTF